MSVKTQMRRSHELFRDVVWPEIRRLEIWDETPSELWPIETVVGDLVERLDRQGGADWAICYEDGGIEFLASRVCGVNRDGYSYREFTVRDAREDRIPTEWDKRCVAAIKGRLLLHWVVQANVIEGRLDWACVARAPDFYACICPQRDALEKRRTDEPNGGWTQFRKVPPSVLDGVPRAEIVGRP